MKALWRKFKEKVFGESGFAGRVLLVLFVVALMIGAMILSGPKPGDDFDPLATPTRPALTLQPNTTPTQRPLSKEYDLTKGVILAVTTVVLVIFIGTAVHIQINASRKQAPPSQE